MNPSASETFGVCPRCGNPVSFYGFGGAPSKSDGKTLVCEDCAWYESLWLWIHAGTKKKLPGLDVDLRTVLSKQ